MEGVGTGSLAAAALHADFDLEKLAPWKEGSPVPFAFLAAAFEAIGSDSKRLAKTQQLVNVFWAILGRTPQDLLPAVYLCTNQVAPSHEGTELGIGDAILIKVRPPLRIMVWITGRPLWRTAGQLVSLQGHLFVCP